VFLDFEKAYDMLWTNGLLTKMKKIGISGNMFEFFKDFVSNRTFQVQLGGDRSNTKLLKNGTPQGSVISPVLFFGTTTTQRATINRATTERGPLNGRQLNGRTTERGDG
jgi:hypothetical protein